MSTFCPLWPLALLVALASVSRADTNPDFRRDAVPILRTQPHLLDYVQSHFEVRRIGIARFHGEGDRPPVPPFIFQARLRGTTGPYLISLLIQPGPEGRVLKVVDSSRSRGPGPAPGPGAPQAPFSPSAEAPGETASAPPAPAAPLAPAAEPSAPAQPSAPAESSTPAEPNADTPSGPMNIPDTSAPSP